MGKIKALIFDLDNTLYDEKEYYKETIKEFAYEFSLDEQKMLKAFYKIYSKGGDILGNILVNSGYSINLQKEFFVIYKDLKSSRVKINSKIKNLLSDLKKQFKLFVLTNGNVEAQKNKIKVLNIKDLFDDIIYAREFHKEKPDCECLNYILSKWNLKLYEVLVIGDNELTDGELKKCGVNVLIVEHFYKNPEIILKFLNKERRK